MSDSNTSPSLTLSEPSVDDSSDSSDEREDLRAKGMSSPSMVDSLSPRPTSVKSDQSVVQRKPDRKSFCKHCIKSYWKKPSPAGGYRCPRCRKRFQTRPSLKLNITLANVVQTQQQTCTSPRPLTRSYAGPRDVACDICIGRKIRAVLVSSISGVQRPAKRKRTELEDDSVSEVRDCAVPNQ
ncbi:E3 ubiquitin/ISG15 ligase TRIM25 [Silurus meridionalis]|nr:E3 ubiquitin/ISG15 ligase TRIM25 [Silurus meridionalis]